MRPAYRMRPAIEFQKHEKKKTWNSTSKNPIRIHTRGFTLFYAATPLRESSGAGLLFSLNLGTLDGDVWSTPRPGRLYPGKDPVPIVQDAGWPSEPVWIGAENLAPTGIRSPDLPLRSNLLYRLHHPGSYKTLFIPRYKQKLHLTYK
jgi:hypothetical protein